jgi:hypothetical protein
MLDRVRLTEAQLEVYELWQECRAHIQMELVKIERAVRNDAHQVGTSAEAVYASADHLKSELMPQLKQIARTIEDREFRQAEERLPR